MMSRRLALSLLWVIVTLVWMLPVSCTWLRRASQSNRRSPSIFESDAWCHTIQLVLHTCSGVLLGLGVTWDEYTFWFIVGALAIHLPLFLTIGGRR